MNIESKGAWYHVAERIRRNVSGNDKLTELFIRAHCFLVDRRVQIPDSLFYILSAFLEQNSNPLSMKILPRLIHPVDSAFVSG